jgi:hypothetical protein
MPTAGRYGDGREENSHVGIAGRFRVVDASRNQQHGGQKRHQGTGRIGIQEPSAPYSIGFSAAKRTTRTGRGAKSGFATGSS